MATETQQSIVQWCEQTFGPVTSWARNLARANEELAELITTLTLDPQHPKAAEECADVVIVLSRLAERWNLNLLLERRTPSKNNNIATTAFDASCSLASVAMLEKEWQVEACDDLRDLSSFLQEICQQLGTSLNAAIDEKMKTNRARVWRLDGTGHGYHVRQETHSS